MKRLLLAFAAAAALAIVPAASGASDLRRSDATFVVGYRSFDGVDGIPAAASAPVDLVVR